MNDNARQKLTDAISALRSTEGWNRWLKTRAAFHTYSFRNTLLIALQCPQASHVAGYRKWQALGYQVQKGEKGIAIFAPMTKKRQDGEKELFGFRLVSVFDRSQVEPIPEQEQSPLDSPVVSIEGDNYSPLVATYSDWARDELGLRVQTTPLQGALGRHIPDAKLIELDPDQTSNSTLRTLIHELAHAHDISYTNYTRPVAEVMADAIAFITCDAIGLDVNTSSVPYIAAWSEAAEEVISEQAAVIDQVSRTLIDVLNNE